MSETRWVNQPWHPAANLHLCRDPEPPGYVPVREWEHCGSCGHLGAECDCQCCWLDEPEDDDGI